MSEFSCSWEFFNRLKWNLIIAELSFTREKLSWEFYLVCGNFKRVNLLRLEN